MKAHKHFSLVVLAAALISLTAAGPTEAQNAPQPRVLRLSFVEGQVTVHRPDVESWAAAPVNTPLQEGFALSTGENSYAEIQFENGGAIRLGQLSVLELTQLELIADGGKINHVELRQGYATFHPLPSNSDESLQVMTPYGTLATQGAARFRVDLDQGMERVEVFDGSVDTQSNMGGMTIEKDSVLLLQPGAPEPTVVSQGITPDDWDQWVEDRESHAQMAQGGNNPGSFDGDTGDTNYGYSDLLQYGSWSEVPGEGEGWTPSMAPAGWSPYSTGQWCWYPGWGYTWIGAEPWGWLPYHYGGWDYIPGKGWAWFPGHHPRWSPAQVTWYHGSDWVGWTPRSYRHEDATACGNHCGGGVVNASTFSNGGALNSRMMLKFNPTSGEKVNEPGIEPTTAVMLPGRAVPSSAALSHGPWGNSAHAPAGTTIATAAKSSPASRHPGAGSANSAIVYDPQQGSYVNGHRVKPAHTTATPGANSEPIKPVPVGNREPATQPTEAQAAQDPNHPVGGYPSHPQPAAAHSNADAHPAASNQGNATSSPAPSGPYSSPSSGHSSGQSGESHSGSGGAWSGGHSAPATGSGGGGGGGGHASAAPSGGGSSAAGRH